MISLKPGVRLFGLSPQIVFAHTVVVSMWDTGNFGVLTITSGSEGNHTNAPRPSGHYAGNALDYRTIGVGDPDRERTLFGVRDRLQKALGPDFLVLLEGSGSENEHLHVEWLPARVS